jgi:hypothetical protein
MLAKITVTADSEWAVLITLIAIASCLAGRHLVLRYKDFKARLGGIEEAAAPEAGLTVDPGTHPPGPLPRKTRRQAK